MEKKDDKTVIETGKTTEVPVKKESATAPMDESADGSVEAPEAKDIDDTLMLLNLMDKEIGGSGNIAEIPESLSGSIKYLIEKLVFVRDLFEDPIWKALLDDMADQKEDGQTPSVEVAIARNIPIEKITQLAESEDYESAQSGLSENLSMQKKAGEEDAEYEASFNESQKAGEEYAAEMGYDEARKNQLFQKVLDLFKVMSDGKLTKAEFAEVDKMLNYGPDTESLRNQLSEQGSKEVLPDKASVESTMSNKQTPQIAKPVGPGMGSMDAYNDTGVDLTQIGKRKRGV